MLGILISTFISITVGTYHNIERIEGISAEKLSPEDKIRSDIDVMIIDASQPFPTDATDNFIEYVKNGGAFLTFGGYAFELLPEKEFAFDFEENHLPLSYSNNSHKGCLSIVLYHVDDKAIVYETTIDKNIQFIEITLYVKTCSVEDKAYFSVALYDDNKKIVRTYQSGTIRGNQDWVKISRVVPITGDISYLEVSFNKEGKGLAWFDDLRIRMYGKVLNTRIGEPLDWLIIDEERLGIFDPSFTLRKINNLRVSKGQHIIPENHYIIYNKECPAAVALTGNNHPIWAETYSRYIPLIYSYDKYNQNIGPYLSLMHIYKGPYKGSSWAFTAGDINFPIDRLLLHLSYKCYLHSLRTDFASYRDDENVRVFVNFANFGKEDREGRIALSIKDDKTNNVIWEDELSLVIKPKTDTLLKFFCDSDLHGHFYVVEAKLFIDGRCWDNIESGFVKLSNVTAESYIDVDDGKILINGNQEFLFGVNQAGFVFSSDNENPLVWNKDIGRMRDSGIKILRQLHFACHLDNVLNPSKSILRKITALHDICQTYGVIFWFDTRLEDVPTTTEELEKEKAFRHVIKETTADFNNLIYELGNEPKFKGDEELRGYYFKRWAMETSKVLNDSNPVTFSTYMIQDMFMARPFVDFISPHYYKQSDELPIFLKIIGSYNSLGEFGAKVHPAWGEYSHNSCVGITEDQAVDWFLKVGHYSLAFGYNSILVWDWKDLQECIFPWGINYVTLVPKKTYAAYRNMAYFFKIVDITYEDPQLYVICPYEERQDDKLKGLIQQMLDFNMDFELVNSRDDVPDGCKKVVHYDGPVIRQLLTAVSNTTNATTTRKYLRHSDDGEVYIFINEDIYKDRKEIQVDSTISIELAKDKSGLVSLNKNGNVVGCEASGTLKMDGKTIINASFHFMVHTLDELPLEKSKSILLLPFSKGEFFLNTATLWEEPMVEVGKIDGGRWNKLGRINIEENILFNIDETDADYIILISEKDILYSKTIPALLKYIL